MGECGGEAEPEAKEADEPCRLVERAAAGDQRAWAALVEQFVDLVWSVARSHSLDHCDAADVTQSTWLRLAEQLDNLRQPERVGAWLVTTARRESLRLIRERRQLDLLGTVPEPGRYASTMSRSEAVDAPVLLDERDRELWTAFKRLTPPCQSLLRAFVAEPPPSYAEVGALFGMPHGSIGPMRARCLDRLRANVLGLRSGSTDPEREVS
ncbi:MAG: RNA polymerase sigma factor [Acidimicrobiales bacterium]